MTRSLKKIKIVFTDVDGVLTDGRLIIMNDGPYGKVFSTRDGQGIEYALKSGMKIYWITGRKDASTENRASELNCGLVFTSGADKGGIVKNILEREGVDREEAVFIGDDIPDLAAKPEVALFACPSDAHPAVLAESDIILNKKGGRGAVRELIDRILSEKK